MRSQRKWGIICSAIVKIARYGVTERGALPTETLNPRLTRERRYVGLRVVRSTIVNFVILVSEILIVEQRLNSAERCWWGVVGWKETIVTSQRERYDPGVPKSPEFLKIREVSG